VLAIGPHGKPIEVGDLRSGDQQRPHLREVLPRNAEYVVRDSERLSVAGPPFTDAIPYAQALIKVEPSRILWGTDFPHPNVKHMPNDGHLVDLLGMMAPDPATLKTIVVDNPTRLYWAN
jgi:hypothetical protein